MSLLRCSIVGTALLASFPFPAVAATFLAEGYSIRAWQTEDGLPQNLVTAAAQTRDGYLWFGTYSGLARFNGERFQVFDPANTPGLGDRRISALFEDAHGTLWIGHESGAITRQRNGRFEPFSSPQGTGSEKIIGIGSDAQGALWAMRENGALEGLNEDRRRLASLIAPHRPEVMFWSHHPRGNIWLAENGRAAHVANGQLNAIALDPPRRDNFVIGIAAAHDGGAWILCDDRIRKWANGVWTEDRGAYPWPAPTPSASLELRDGTLAIGTIRSGLSLIFRDGRPPVHLDRHDGLPQDWVRFLYEDREGTLWAGTGSAGLVSIRPTAFSVLNAPDEWLGCSVLAVAPGRSGDALWIGTDGAGLYHHVSGNWTHFGGDEGLPNWYIPAVVETPGGEVWASMFWWGTPLRLDDGRFVRPAQVEETWSPALALVAVPGSSGLLVGNRDGLVELTANGAQWLLKSPGGTADDVCALIRDRAGVIWCGFAQSGLARLADGTLTMYRRPDGLGSDGVQCLYADDDGTLWIGTADAGLSRFKDGRFANIGVAQGLADNVVCHILDDHLGYLWLSTHHGIQRIAKTELNRCADRLTATVTSQVYDRSDGLPIIEFLGARQSAACRTGDGRLWFATSKGLVSVDPAKIQPNPIAPPVVCESVRLDGRAVPWVEEPATQRLPPDHRRLEFRFSALSFAAPSKVLFKYKLEGLDRDWVDAGPKRTASYSQLHAGTYRFRVIACNNDGLWNTEGAAVCFVVAPFFWQTWWFVGSSTVAVLVAVTWLVRSVTRRRLQRRMEQLERQHALERERARIAQDIHDDVGTSLARIAMLSQPAHEDLTEPPRTAALLARIYHTARDVTRALDEIVWAVSPRHDTLDSLVSYISKFAQDLLGAGHIRCRLDLPVELPGWPLTAEIRHNLFLAVKETLNNVLKHAAATEVRLSLHLLEDSFVLEMRDNGRGFDPTGRTAAPPGRSGSRNGLQNMTRRLASIGGRCEIASAPNQGTRVLFHVPARDLAHTSSRPSTPAGDRRLTH